ncbi:cell division protein FtsW [Actinoplanes lutulentus]|uniref:Probable peptidoglycan glycosyltransferase FtsW n=1 Tax=Actinoplanes lutulentus TaxID=1287878 RepID=A0A327ZDX3_9ACTN|nr:putative peptidoglycan glycosyltransferase FtsW [Actinoplanes lutulentus]MBB2941610.1 cell division protein FtsW [Actinoplanes lutulentus]RAK39530.1 cell division-specific peptidoglycan biosynthesis regulator FtsW [Actinoplanes lutulentus]
MADDRIHKARPSLSRQLMPAVHGLLARPLSSYYLLIASSGLLLLIGLTMVFSATSVKAFAASGNAFADISSQAVYALLGLVGFWVCQRLPAQTLRTLGKYIMGIAIVLLVILAVLHALASAKIGKGSIGPIKAELNWLYFGPVSLQPGELAKVGMVLWGADVIARKGPKLGHWRELAMPLFPVIGLLFVLVGYNDLGTMLVLLSLIVGLLWAAGVRMRFFAALGVLGLAGVGLLIAAASRGAGSGTAGEPNYRLERLTSFLTPLDKCDPNGTCYQIIQGRSAIFEGGWFGVGLGKGALKWGWVPEADNDFIFAIVAEELGVVGCAVVLALLSVLAYTGFRIARRSSDPFRRLAASAITTWLVAQAVINMGGVVGLLPITGLPLPFISAGGTALVVTLAAIGMLASFARAEPDAARALNARPTPRWVRLVWAPLPPLPPPRRTGSARPPAQKKPVGAGDGRRR